MPQNVVSPSPRSRSALIRAFGETRSATSPIAIAALLAVLVAALAIRLFLFQGFSGFDDAEYSRFAYLFANGRPFPADYVGPAVFPLRVGTWMPVALLYRIFGLSEAVVGLYPLIMSLAGVVLAYCCASLLFGWRAGVVAALLLAFFDRDIDLATELLPDLPASVFAAAGVTMIALLDQRTNSSKQWTFWGGALGGLAFGLSWLSKESVAYLAPFCGVLMLIMLRRHGSRALWLWGGVAAGAGVVLLGEIATYYSRTGDLLFRFHEIERNYHQWPNGFFTEGSDFGWTPGSQYSEALFDRLFISGPRTILFNRALYFVPLIGLAATAYGWWRRDRSFLLPGLWLWGLVLVFNFSSSSAEEYLPLPLFIRYMYPIFFPAIVLTGGLLARCLFSDPETGNAPRPVVRATGAIVALVILWAAAPFLYFGIRNPPSIWLTEVRMLREKTTPQTVLYADAITLRGLEFFNEYPVTTSWRHFDKIASADEIPNGSLVVVNDRYISWLDKNAGMWVAWPGPGPTDLRGYRMHEFFKHAPQSWTLVWHNDNARMYTVGKPAGSLSEVLH